MASPVWSDDEKLSDSSCVLASSDDETFVFTPKKRRYRRSLFERKRRRQTNSRAAEIINKDKTLNKDCVDCNNNDNRHNVDMDDSFNDDLDRNHIAGFHSGLTQFGSDCLRLSKGKDLCELKRHTYANTVDYKTLKKLVQKLFPSCRCKEVHQKHAEAVQEVEKGEGEIDVSMETPDKERLCPGHERAMPIERTVMELDVKEEGISTLMCYLELHSQQWLENLSSVYASCKVQCYGGPNQLQAVSKKCPPVAVAIAKARKDGKSFTNTNMIEFPVVEISDAMGWSSGPVKKELKLLQWDFTGAAPRKTGIMVEFSELAYHFRSPGDLSIEELDDILQFLHTRVQKQEKSEVYNLSRLYQALKSVSHKNYWMCCDNLDMSRNDKLKAVLNEYFDSQSLEETDEVSMVTEEPTPYVSLDQVISDIRQFHNLYGQEHSLSGRAIARIFHGIASPCFPATTWGRVRRFWRSHLDMDFNELMKLATKELIGLR